jgi:hypothetical protein
LKKGKSTLEVSAPNYKSTSIEVDLKRGENVLDDPVELTGVEIPDLYGFYAFENEAEEEYLITLRPITKDNYAIQLHPAIPLWVGVRVKDWKNKLPTTLEQFDKQPVLYEGHLEWEWDAYPETQFRYIASLPFSLLKDTGGDSYAIEYLVVVPNLKVIDSDEFNTITARLETVTDEEIGSYLDSIHEKIFYYSDISYDVRRTR